MDFLNLSSIVWIISICEKMNFTMRRIGIIAAQTNQTVRISAAFQRNAVEL